MTIILLIIAGISAAIMWKIQFHWEKSIFSEYRGRGMVWVSPLGWLLKYKNADPSQGPAFWGSTTIFVWITDGFHFFQLVMYTALEVALVLNGVDLVRSIFPGVAISPWVVFVLNVAALKGCRGFTFELFFTHLLDMEFWNSFLNKLNLAFADAPRGVSIVLMTMGFFALVGISFIPDPYGVAIVLALFGSGFTMLLISFIRSILRDWKREMQIGQRSEEEEDFSSQ